MSAVGTKLPIQNVRFSVAIGGKADLHRTARFDAIDPTETWAVQDFRSAKALFGLR
jgi:hypothetical protein